MDDGRNAYMALQKRKNTHITKLKNKVEKLEVENGKLRDEAERWYRETQKYADLYREVLGTSEDDE